MIIFLEWETVVCSRSTKMKNSSEFFIVDKKVLPDVFLKVVEVKRLIESGKAETILQAVNSVGLSRSAFYKYRDFVFELNENNRGKTVTISFNLDDTPGLLSNVLNIIADYGANVLTINQTIPINKVANVTVTMETGAMKGIISGLIDCLEKKEGVKTLKIIARE